MGGFFSVIAEWLGIPDPDRSMRHPASLHHLGQGSGIPRTAWGRMLQPHHGVCVRPAFLITPIMNTATNTPRKLQTQILASEKRKRRRWIPCICAGLGMAFLLPGVCIAEEKKEEGSEILPPGVEKFEVRTRSEMNRAVPFYIRAPKGYQAGQPRRLLFLCPHLNQKGLDKLNGSGKYLDLADERGWFVMTCTFLQDKKNAQDRELSYYYPEAFSGKALVQALDIAARKYPIDTQRIFMQGLSGGAQFVHRFAMWAPERVTAVVVNSSSWFDSPGEECNRTAWMIIIGESDPAYDASLTVTQELRDVGAAPLFRSYIGMAHEGGGPAINSFALEFFKFHDDRTKQYLGVKESRLDPRKDLLSMPPEEMPYVGDSQLWNYVENTPENLEEIPEDSRVFLPSEKIAEMWKQ